MGSRNQSRKGAESVALSFTSAAPRALPGQEAGCSGCRASCHCATYTVSPGNRVEKAGIDPEAEQISARSPGSFPGALVLLRPL